MDNALMVIFPYQYEGTWVFDDPDVDLVKEPFVFGVPEMIDDLVSNIPEAPKGFKLIFSKKAFPGHKRKLSWVREECEGNWYTIDGEEEGWLCPALFKYFDKAPLNIFVKAESK
ncbi:DUF6717 family protein [Microbulbifer aggregans]|uniref:DUF6717 family protein n=1 Tax=Microbulbifer aggregans TaxID=1769779 RepID=UPI001CFD1C32|nr:DUF6717 family protein [Microbulbifer aggregans]